jgi:glycosyltransferase involved in cell wall biosynthesis
MKVAVVTPTIGNSKLVNCLASVDAQTYKDIVHYIFIDGQEYKKTVYDYVQDAIKVKTIELQENVGKGWYGHRVFAACSFLVNADIICYLDEDNWFEPCHVKKLVEKIEAGNDWAYSLRKIYDKEGNYICDDNCESLGKWPVYFNKQVFHIDTSSFAIKRDVAVRVGHAWYGQWGADRQFFSNLSKYFPKFDCTNEHTSCYRLDGNPKSVTKEFFEKGNSVMKEKYGNSFPWKTEESHQINVGPGITILI